MKLIRLLSPVPGPVGAVVISLQADWGDSIGWNPELLQCERREVCHGTGLATPPPVLLSSHMYRTQVWPLSSPPLYY